MNNIRIPSKSGHFPGLLVVGFLLLIITSFSIFSFGCSSRRSHLSEEDKLRKRLGVKSETKWNDDIKNQIRFYDRSGRLIEEKWLNPKGMAVTGRKLLYDQKTGLLQEIIWLKADYVEKSKYQYSYDKSGNLLNERRFTAYDELIIGIDYVYDGGNLSEEIRYDSRQDIIYQRQYSYQNGRQTELTEYNNKNEASNRHLYEYDESGNKIKELRYDVSGELILTKHFVYTDGLPTEEIQYDKNNEIVNRVIREYDPQGLLLMERWLDSEDNLVFANSYSYEYY